MKDVDKDKGKLIDELEQLRQRIAELEASEAESNKIEEALKQSESRYKELAESITDVFFAMDEKLRYTYWNRASEALTGISAKDALGKGIYDIFSDDEATRRTVNAYRKALATRKPQHFVNERSLGGRDCVFDISAYPTTHGICVYVKDITEHKKLEEALSESEQWYRHVFDNAPFGIGFASIDGKVINLNKAMETITGYSAEEFNKINLADTYVNKADREVLLKEIRQHGGVVDYPVQLRRKDGTPYDALITDRLTTIGDREFVQTICHDVTECKKAEEALKESEERYRSLVELSPEAIFVASEGKHVFMNSAGLKLLGASSPDQIIGKPVTDVIHPDYRKIVTQRMRKSMETGIIPPAIEEKFLRLDGTEIDVEVRAAPLIYRGKPAMQAVVGDISERKRAEESLRLSEQNFRDSIENSPLGIRIVSEDGKMLYANRALLDICGYGSIKELKAVPRKQLYTPESYAEHKRRVKKRKLGEYVPPSYEIGIVRKDGQVRHLAVSRGEVLWNGEKQFQVVYQDITERKARGEEYQTIIHATMDGFWQADMQGRFLDVNEAYCNLVGYSRDELLSMSISDVEAIEKSEEIAEHMQRIKEIGYDRFESRHRHKDGEIVDVEVSVNYLPTYGGRMFTFIRDITERKQAEAELRTRDFAMASSISGILLLDFDGVVLYANKAYLDMWLYRNVEEVVGHNIKERAANKESAKRLLTTVRTRGEWKGELETHLRDGRIIDVLLSASIVRDEKGVPLAIVASVIDITELKRAEEVLRESEKRYRLIAENASDVIWTTDMNLKMTYISPSCINLNGYLPEEAIDLPFDKGITPESLERVMKVFMEGLADESAGRIAPGQTRSFEAEFIGKDGTTVWTETIVTFIRNEDGKAIGIQGVTRNIDARKRAEEALRESEAHYRLLAENVRDVIWATDMDFRFTYVSPSVKYLGDRTAEEVMSLSLGQLLTSSSQELAMKTFAEELVMANATPQDPTRSRTLEVEFLRRDGSALWAELKMNFMRDTTGRPIGILGVMRDITERKKAEAQRREFEQRAQLASHLASVGELSAGVAHEINNPLTGVIGYAELLMREDVPEHIKNDLEIIRDGAKRVASIVKGLLTFARQAKPERTVVDINQVIEVCLRLRAYELKTSDIKVVTNLAPDLPSTIADAGQLQQVFLNLLINAEMEMKLAHGKGKLIIKAEQLDNTIRISFKDDGPGIAGENLERIFDPFFSTREIGKGTGLGLSICHGIVAEHGGRIWAESKLGKGATFIVELPVVTAQKPPRRTKVARKLERATKGKILVVDDEPVVRRLLSQILIEEGHEVEATDDGKDALNRIKSNRYNLILLDMKLPGMSGSELYGRVKEIAESLAQRVVFITGDVMGADTEAFLARTGVPYIHKPFDVEQLKSEIGRLLAIPRLKDTTKSQISNKKPKVKS